MATGALPAQTARLFRVRKTVCKMLNKRGYNIPDEDIEMDADGFRSRFGDTPSPEVLHILAAQVADSTDRILVFFVPGDLNFKDAKPMKDNACRRGIIVVGGRLTAATKKFFSEFVEVTIESFQEDELLVDITEHELVPTHILLTNEEKAALLARYKLKENQLPRIPVGDPVARYYGMQRGQVAKIIRPSETAGRYVTYRIVS